MKRLGLFMLMILMTIVLAACSTENDPVELENGYVYKEKSKFKEFDSYNFVAKDYDIELHYPHFGEKRIDEKIEMNRDREYEDFVNLVEADETDGEASLRIVFNPHDVRGEIFMFNITKVVKLTTDTDYSHHGILAVNTNSGEAVLRDNLFDTEPTTREALFYRLDQSIKDTPSIAPYYDEKKLEERIMDISKTFNNVDFKGDTVQFHFEQDEIGSSAMGTPTVELAFIDVVEFLEPGIKAVVEGESMPTKEEK